MAKTAILSYVVLPFVALSASAQEPGPVPQPSRPYSFSGPCTSQGSWTAAALSQTARLREIITQLKSDGNCSAISKSLSASLNRVDQNLKTIEMESSSAGRLTELPQEIAGLRQFAAGEPEMHDRVMDNLLGRAIEHARLGAKTDALMTKIDGSNAGADLADDNPGAVLGMRDRVRAAANSGLDIFNDMLDAAPQMEECLINKEGSSQYFAAAVKVLSSFASSGQDGTGKRLAESVHRLGKVFGREGKFAELLKQLNEQDFLVSMTCLMEVTSESFCAARDARSLFDTIMKQKSITGRGEARSSDNPLYGYYILNEHLPVVNRWLEQVQIGIIARRPEDASAKNKVQSEVTRFQADVAMLEATINATVDRIATEPDIEQQRAIVRKLMQKIIGEMKGQDALGGEGTNPNRENFFNAAGDNTELAFKLIGEEVPAEFAEEDGTRSAYDFIELKMKHIFKDPRDLLAKIEKNFADIVLKGRKAADSFFQRFYSSDRLTLMSKTLLGPNLNVRTALRGILTYLSALDRKMRAQGDASNIGTVRETARRLKDILQGFDEVQAYNEALAKKPALDEDGYTDEEAAKQDVELLATAEKLLEIVTRRLEMPTMQTSFLATRLSILVNKDYENMLRSGQNFSAYHQELYQATGQALVDSMIRIGNGNPVLVDQDLNMAMRLNKGNIEIMQRLLMNPFAAQISFLKLVGENKQPGNGRLWWESTWRPIQEGIQSMPGQEKGILGKTVGAIFGAFWTSFINSDRYPYLSPGNLFRFVRGRFKYSPDDEFGSAKKLQAQMCIQALAFADVRPFWPLCKDVVMKTPYHINSDLKINQENAADYLSVDFQKKAYESKDNPALNHSKRICAFRDYNRRNLVMYLTEKNR